MPLRLCSLLILLALLVGCAAKPGAELKRRGDEIMVAGRLFHTGTPVVLWTDPGGYDAYRTERRFVPWSKAAWAKPDKPDADLNSPNRLGIRYAPRHDAKEMDYAPLTEEQFEQVRGGAWDLDLLRQHVDQFVLHYDVCGVSRQCFRILHDFRGLSVHFMLDIDGTIYQTMDLKDKGWHATTSNNRSVGVEIANMGAYARGEKEPFAEWYEPDPPGWDWDVRDPSAPVPIAAPFPPRITIPSRLGDGGVRTKGTTFSPARLYPIVGTIQNRELRQMDFTKEQYDALIKLTAALHVALPKIALDYPRDAEGKLVTQALDPAQLESFQGVIAHYHIQTNKSDPGPALQWDKVINGARAKLGKPRLPEGDAINQPIGR